MEALILAKTWTSDMAGYLLLLAAVFLMLGLLLRERYRRKLHAGAISNDLENAKRETENIRREARLAASEEAQNLRAETEKSLAARQSEVSAAEQRQGQREQILNQQLDSINRREARLHEQESANDRLRERFENDLGELAGLIKQQREALQQVSRISEAEARRQLMQEVEREALQDANDLSNRILSEAQHTAEERARRIISLAIQRYAGAQTIETTTATISLAGDEMKGRIIGREGRNIRAFEAATGVTVMVDDTPNAVVLSGFDPVRREIAREAMQQLILDGRIHPTRIEEVVAKVTAEMNESIHKAGAEALLRAGLPVLGDEIVKTLGRLRFRHSFAQNVLEHSIEVAHLMGLLAAELGLDVTMAKRCGLLHDIGKALDHEVEGPHAIVGAAFLKRHGEPAEVIDGVASHHDEVAPIGPWGILVSAADAISASRPGARSETMTVYLKRLEDLERIGASFAGVEKCFAVQAGRDLRVMVQPDQIGDKEAAALARSIARKVEEELHYPGQIRVTIIRETRVVEYAK
jgi:ribonuclease Y